MKIKILIKISKIKFRIKILNKYIRRNISKKNNDKLIKTILLNKLYKDVYLQDVFPTHPFICF